MLIIHRGACSLLARSGSPDLIKIIVSAGVSPNSTNQRDEPLLVSAIKSGSAEVVQTLLSLGADPNVKFKLNKADEKPITVAKYAQKRGSGRIQSIFTQLDSKETPTIKTRSITKETL